MWLLGCFGLLPFAAADTWWTSAAWSYTYLKTAGSRDDVVCDQCVIEFDGNLVVGGSQGIDGISYERDSFNGFLCKVSEPISAPSTWMYSDMTRFDWDMEPKSRTSWKRSHMTGLGKTQSHIILVGYTYGDMEDFGTNLGAPSSLHTQDFSDAVVLAYTSAGILAWGRQVGTNYNDFFGAVSVSPSNEIYAAGSTAGDVAGHVGADDIFFYRYSSSGDLINKYQLGTTGNDYVYSLWHHGSNEVYLGGKTDGTWPSKSNTGGSDVLLIKFNADLEETWSAQRGSSADDDCAVVQVNKVNGDAYVVGNTRGSIDGQTYFGGNDFFLMKFDVNGNWKWTRQHGSSSDETVHGLWVKYAATPHRILLAGTTAFNTGFDGATPLGSTDAFVVEYQDLSSVVSPTHVSTELIGSDRLDEGKGFVERSNGDIYLVGGTEFDPQDTNSYGELDAFVQLLTTTTTTETSTSLTQTTLTSTSHTLTSSSATSVTQTSSTATSTSVTRSTSSTSSSITQTSSTGTSSTQTTSTKSTSTGTSVTSTSTTASSSSSTTSTTTSATSSTSSSSSTRTSSTTTSSTSITATTSSTVSTTTSTQSTSTTTTSSVSTTSLTRSSSTTTTSSSSSTSSTSSSSSTSVTNTSTTTSSSTSFTTTSTSTFSTTTTTSTLTSTLSSTTFSTTASVTEDPNAAPPTAPLVVPCSGGLPSGPGVVLSDCSGKVSGETCTATCDAGFEGGPAEFLCSFLGIFAGPALSCSPASCPSSALPGGFDISDCGSTELDSFCFVRCLAGFVSAESIFTCLGTGNFSGTAPTCVPIQCSMDALPHDSSLNVTSCIGTTAGNTCEVSCNVGHDGQGGAYTCQDTGHFQLLTAPSCARKECPVPRALSTNAFTTDCSGGILHGQRCVAACRAGHSGAPTEFLCENGLLIGEMPTCEALPCTLTGTSMGLGLNTSACEGTRTGSSCALHCSFGYQAIGDPSMTCQSDGTFLQSGPFRCEPSVCGNLSDHAASPFSSPRFLHTCEEKSFGQTCSVICGTGWDLQGNATVMLCQTGGYVEALTSLPAESSLGPTCVPRECTAKLPGLRGVVHDCVGKTTLQSCTVEPALGFAALEGSKISSTLLCGTDGEFKGSLPSIQAAQCPTPSFGLGVGSTCENKSIGAECWAYCLAGYAGSPQPYHCVADGTLGVVRVEPLAQEVLCTASARRLTAASGCATSAAETLGLQALEFEHSCASMAHEDVCISHCSLGWALTGDASVLQCKDGLLDGNIPQCDPVPCTYNLPNSIGVKHNCSGIATGDTCVATCSEEGFTYASGGAETFECLPTGEFQGQSPSCVPTACRDLALASHFEHRCSNMVYGDCCSVGCAHGFSLVGSAAQYRCSASGDIEGTEPRCDPKQCVNSVPESFDSDCEGIATGSSCNVSCVVGMVPNSARLICHGTGMLVGPLPTCIPNLCPFATSLQKPSLANDCQDVAFGRSCSVFCAEGYKLTSGSVGEVWDCALKEELTLSGSLPSCEALTCPMDLRSSHAFQDNCTDGLPVGAECMQTCSQGFKAAEPESSSATFTCMLDLSIDAGQRLQCVPVECNSTISIPNLEHSCTGVTANDTCFAFCRSGFTSTAGVVQWTCSGPGSAEPIVDKNLPIVDGYVLKGDVPECLPKKCKYNIPLGTEYLHNCHNISTDGTCEVSCPFGWLGDPVSLSCSPTGALIGGLPSCSPTVLTLTTTATATTSTFGSSTVTLRGFLDLRLTPSEGRRLQGAELFAVDFKAQEALAAALAQVLEVEMAALHLELRAEGDLLRALYAASRSWSSAELARSWAEALQESMQSTSLVRVKDLLNQKLAGTGFQVNSIDAFEVSIALADGVAETVFVGQARWGVGVLVIVGSLVVLGLFCGAWRLLRQPATTSKPGSGGDEVSPEVAEASQPATASLTSEIAALEEQMLEAGMSMVEEDAVVIAL